MTNQAIRLHNHGQPGRFQQTTADSVDPGAPCDLGAALGRNQAGGRGWPGQKAGLWLGYDVCVDGGLLRSVTSPAQRGRSDAVAAGRGCVAVTCGATPTSASPSPSPEARPLPEGEVAALLAAQHSSIREFDIFATPLLACPAAFPPFPALLGKLAVAPVKRTLTEY